MRVLFIGSGQVACPALRALAVAGKDPVVGVVTQPDRPSGRRLQLAACPVKQLAESLKLPVSSPEKIGSPDQLERMAALKPDMMVVADYGQFLPAAVLALPPKGALNIHPSLLPKYRGAAPVQWAIANGEIATGVTVLYVTERMDAGDILAQEPVPVRDDATAAGLTPLLAELGASLLLRVLDHLRAGTLRPRPQDEAAVSFAPRLKKEDGRLDWRRPAEELRNRIRGFTPWPGGFAEAPAGSGRRLRIAQARVEAGAGVPGVVLECGGAGPLVACGEKALRLLEVQPEGGKAMAGAAYVCGHRLKVGDRLG